MRFLWHKIEKTVIGLMPRTIENGMDENALDTGVSQSLEASRFHGNQLSLGGSLENSHKEEEEENSQTFPLSDCDAELAMLTMIKLTK